jgi:hypothetical protein
MYVIFEIDGILASYQHRLHFMQQDPKDYENFHAACSLDTPNNDWFKIFEAFITLKKLFGYSIVILTHRPERTRGATEKWLFKNISQDCNRV